MINVTPVIPCGGSGARLWLLSRTKLPKQFLYLTDNDNLFQQAAQRLTHLSNANIQVANPVPRTHADHHTCQPNCGQHGRLHHRHAKCRARSRQEIIKVQLGGYLDEDNTIRFEASYYRTSS